MTSTNLSDGITERNLSFHFFFLGWGLKLLIVCGPGLVAAGNGQLECLQWLIDHGADCEF